MKYQILATATTEPNMVGNKMIGCIAESESLGANTGDKLS